MGIGRGARAGRIAVALFATVAMVVVVSAVKDIAPVTGNLVAANDTAPVANGR